MDFEKEWRSIGMVLDAFNSLEITITRTISLYVRPGRDEFFEKYILHSSIVPFGSKIKLIRAIAREVGGPSVDSKHLNRSLSCRNALAHFCTLSGLRFNFNALREEPYGPRLVIETLGSQDLRLEEKTRDEIVANAIESMKVAMAEVERLERHLEDRNKQDHSSNDAKWTPE